MKPILSVTLIALAAIVAILSWYGLFARVTISEQTISPFSFAYKKQTGNYRQSGRAMNELYVELGEEGISTTKGVGLYYDNPRKVAVNNLRSLAGCILPEASTGKWEGLRAHYLVGSLPGATLPVITFPYKGKLSVVLGTLRVYPKLNAWFKNHPEQNGPVMEIYDISEGEIRYVVARPMGSETLDALWQAELP